MKIGGIAFLMMCGVALGLSSSIATPAAAQGQPLIMAGPCGHYGYHPVCARSRKKTLVTYVNECAARGDGARIVSAGACPTNCPMVFKPVCALDARGKRKTFGNDCQAKAAGAKILRGGRCVPLVR